MIKNSRKQKTESGTNAAASACAPPQHPATSNQHPAPIRHSSFVIRHSRPGLTLIELLVTIVIMVTVLAGVLPLVSPNNNSRKLREASRQLNSLLSQAQAQAARDGRPVGVAFRETGTATPYSGMALEAYLISEPRPFAGFSEFSRVQVYVDPDNHTYGPEGEANPLGNSGVLFDPKYTGQQIWNLAFTLYGQEDPVPPRMVRIGDVLNISGNLYLIVDDADPDSKPNRIDPETGYVLPTSELRAVWLNRNGQEMPPGPRAYTFRRQPMNTPEQPLQFPRGIGVDLDASGATGVGPSMPMDLDASGQTTIGIMFSPNGSIDALYRDGVRREGVEQVYLLLGLFENGNNGSQDPNDYDFSAGGIADDELVQRRSRLNWLHADSRWVTVNRAGRIITAENNVSFDPRQSPYIDNLTGTPEEKAREQRRRQILGVFGNGSGTIYSAPDSYTRADSRLEAFGARLYAQQMSGSTGR